MTHSSLAPRVLQAAGSTLIIIGLVMAAVSGSVGTRLLAVNLAVIGGALVVVGLRLGHRQRDAVAPPEAAVGFFDRPAGERSFWPDGL